jgi:hypothetical protein
LFLRPRRARLEGSPIARSPDRVPDQVAFRCDWSEALAQQNDRVRQMIGLLAAGYLRCNVTEKFGITRPAITQRMDRVRRDWD